MKIPAVLALVAAAGVANAAVLYNQPVHAPGTPGGNGLSCFQGTLGTVFYNRQIADDFSVPSPGWYVDAVNSWLVPFTNTTTVPVTGVNVEFWTKSGSLPGTVYATATNVGFTLTQSSTLYFARNLRELKVNFDRITLPAGDYFVMIQLVTDDNWFWLTHSGSAGPFPGDPAATRTGPGGTPEPNYNASWTSTGPPPAPFNVRHEMAFNIKGDVIPTPGALALLGLGGLAAVRRRR